MVAAELERSTKSVVTEVAKLANYREQSSKLPSRMSSFALFCDISILFYFFMVCQSVPVPFDLAKHTCKHKRNGLDSEWADCIKTPAAKYDLVHPQFADSIRDNGFIDAPLRVHPNDFQCFSVHMYSESSATKQNCPAICKLKYSNEGRDKKCSHNHLMVDTESAVNIASPRYKCGLQYRPKEICLYNVSLSCGTNHAIISAGLSSLSLADGDFLDIIDFSQKKEYNAFTDAQSLERDFHVQSSQFVVLFSSSGSEKASGAGFSLHIECAVKPTTRHEDGSEEGSATIELFP